VAKMKYYQFNPHSLKYEETPKGNKILSSLVIFFITVSLLLGIIIITYKPNHELMVLRKQEIPFSEDLLRQEIQNLNLRFEDILVEQARLETGGFKSNIYLTNNNLFGMKRAYSRPKIQDGEANGHACYVDWKQSVLDMALFQSYSCKDIKTEDEYFYFLDKVYAEDPNYTKTLKKLLASKD